MSYDLYCYKSQLGKPDLEEALSVLEPDEHNGVKADPETKLVIAKALIAYNPRLEGFEFEFENIAKHQGISVEDAKEKFDFIELNTSEGELATQITIYDDNVSIIVPYWYPGDKADDIFKKIIDYTKIIRQTAGYFVYDPQVEHVYDPMKQDFDGLPIYKSMTEVAEQKMNQQSQRAGKKPWWKFW